MCRSDSPPSVLCRDGHPAAAAGRFVQMAAPLDRRRAKGGVRCSSSASLHRCRYIVAAMLAVVAAMMSTACRAQKFRAPKPDLGRPLDALPDARPPLAERKFTSKLVEDEIASVASRIKDKALRRIWMNAYPNTLDTTVAWHDLDEKQPLETARPQSFLITGDITALWIRDSTNQINPYLHLLEKWPAQGNRKATREWEKLYRLALGLLYVQAKSVLVNPYANSFGPPSQAPIEKVHNHVMYEYSADADWIFPPPINQKGHWDPRPENTTAYAPGLSTDGIYIYEAKWEVDSLASFVRLAVRLAQASGRTDFIDKKHWREALGLALSTMKAQQRSTDEEKSVQGGRSTDEAASFHPSDEMEQMQEIGDVSPENAQGKPATFLNPSTSVYSPQPDLSRMRVDPIVREDASQSNAHLVQRRRRQGAEHASSNLTGRPAGSDPAVEGSNTVLSKEWDRRFKPLGGYYRYQRNAYRGATETRSEDGFGEPAARTGMVKSAFRPSDDATIYPFFVPGNAMLAVVLSDLAKIIDGASTPDAQLMLFRDTCKDLAKQINDGILAHAVAPRRSSGGTIFQYEVDGYGNQYFMDDANVPSLLSLPYLGFVDAADETYQRTRKLVLSSANKYYFKGPAGNGIGGPHVGYGKAWPMSHMMQILTTNSSSDHLSSLAYLRNVTTGTGLMHESVNVHDASDFSREWFAWANGLFGEAILHVLERNPALLTDQVYE